MKKIIALFSFLSIICVCCVVGQSDAEMKVWQNYMTPGDVHKMIALADGEWNGEISMWMDPTKPPSKTTTTAKNEMILGGRYQLSKSTGTMMGMPFEGMSLMGYDNAKKVFTSTWVDNFGTGTMTLEGTWDNQSKSITLKGKAVDPTTGKDMDVKEVMKFIDKDTQQMQMYNVMNGTEMKTMEINLTRKK